MSERVEQLYFDDIAEHRDTYMVHYRPPSGDAQFSSLSITFLALRAPPIDKVVEGEIRRWLARYQVPIMAFAWDRSEDLLSHEDSCSCVGWRDEVTGQIVLSWDYNDLTRYVEMWTAPEDWRTIFVDVPVRTKSQMRQLGGEATRKTRRQILSLRVLLVIWAVAIPVATALFEFFGPQWLAAFTLAIALASAWGTFRKLWGLERMSAREERDAEKRSKMEHYFYHCELNPAGFASLKLENFKRDAEDRIRKEAADMRRQR